MLPRRLHWVLIGALFPAATPAMALEHTSYSDAAFDAALLSGRPVLLQAQRLRRPSCPDQWQAADHLADTPATADAVVMLIDTESQRSATRRFHISVDCTLVAFQGGHETGRRVGTVDPVAIQGMFTN